MSTISTVRTSKGKLGRRVSASLVVSDETQDLAEAGHGQQPAVLRVCDLPYLTQYRWRKLGPLEELDGNLACDDAELLGVGLLKEVLKDALLVRREVEDGRVCAWLASIPTAVDGCSHILNSPLPERSAMAVEVQMAKRVVVMGEACNEAEAPSCRVIARGSCVLFPAGRRPRKVGWLAAASQHTRTCTRRNSTTTTTTTTETDNRSSRRRMGVVMVMESDRCSETVPEAPSSSSLRL
jgi:hypothetical protein